METPIKLNPKQLIALRELLEGTAEKVLYGGAAAGGKSWLGCLWLWIMCRKYPNTRWFIARRHIKDLDASSVSTFLKVVRNYEGRGQSDYSSDRFWRYSRSGAFIQHLRNGSRVDLVATEYEPTDPQYNRFGSIEFTGGWLEEVQETSRTAATVLLTRIGRHLNADYDIKAKCLLTCNPSKGWLYTDYYRPYVNGSLGNDKAVIFSTMADNAKFLPAEYLAKMAAIDDPAIRQRLTEGKWEWDEDESFLVPSRLLAMAVEVPAYSGAIRVGIDVGLGGPRADKTVIQVVRGNIIEQPMVIDPADYTGDPALYDDYLTMQIAGIINELGPLEPNAVRIDVSGVGDAIYQKLKHSAGLGCWPFRGSNPAFPRRGSQQKLFNLRAQAYWELKEGLRLKKWHLPAAYDEELFEEVTIQKYTCHNDVIGLADKKIIRQLLGRSPDKADALSMACLELPAVLQSATITTAGSSSARRRAWSNNEHRGGGGWEG